MYRHFKVSVYCTVFDLLNINDWMNSVRHFPHLQSMCMWIMFILRRIGVAFA